MTSKNNSFYVPNFVNFSRLENVYPKKYATVGGEYWDDSYQQRNSCAVVAVFPFDHKPTYNPLYTEAKNATNQTDPSVSAPLPLDLTETLSSVRTTQSKNSPIWTCEAEFTAMPKNNLLNQHPNKTSWLTQDAPFALGDWMAVWVLDNREDQEKIQNALSLQTIFATANELTAWRSGWKFLGRIREITPVAGVSADGVPELKFRVVAAFDVWESPISLHPMMLTLMAAKAGQFAQEVLSVVPLSHINPKDGKIVQDIVLNPDEKYWGARLLDFFSGEDVALVPPHKALSFLLDGLLTFGVYGETVKPSIDFTTIPSPTSLAANPEMPPLTPYKAPFLPNNILRMFSVPFLPLSIDTWCKGDYSPIIPYQGIDNFNLPNTVGLYMAREIGLGSQHELVGSTLLMQGNFNGDDLWSVMSRFSNIPVNEVFCSLKAQPLSGQLPEVDPEGILSSFSDESWVIMPTFTARQLPFNTKTTQAFLAAKAANPATPRVPPVQTLEGLRHWAIHPSFIKEISLSKNNPIINVVQISGTDVRLAVSNQDVYKAMKDLYNPPVIDSISVARYGLKEFSTEVSGVQTFLYNNSPKDFVDPAFFSRMMADIKMRQHRYYTGEIVCHAIQEPICIGDNIVIKGDVDGATYYHDGFAAHIVSVTHSTIVAEDGRTFSETRIGIDWGTFDEDDSYDVVILPKVETIESEIKVEVE